MNRAKDSNIGTVGANEIDRVDGVADPDIGRVSANETNRADRAENPDIGIANIANVDKTDGAKVPDIVTASVDKADRVKDLDIDTTDAHGVEDLDIDIVSKNEVKDLNIGITDTKNDQLLPPADKQAVAKRLAILVSLFSFRKFFFSSLKLKIGSSSLVSILISLLFSVDTPVK